MHTSTVRRSLEQTLVTTMLATMLAACGSNTTSPAQNDASVTGTGVTPPYCTDKPAAALSDLSGRWVIKEMGSLLVTAPAVSTLRTQTILYAIADMTSTGIAVRLEGRYCDRNEVDSATSLVKVAIPDAWAHTGSPFVRTGTYTPIDGSAVLAIDPLVEVFGATLDNPTDPLPTDPTDPRIVDVDGDLHPGLTVNLTGLFTASLYSVQRQTTSMLGIPVSANRIEGTLSFLSEQTVVGSTNPQVQALYSAATNSADFDICRSTFAMVRVGAAAAGVDGGTSGVDGGAAGIDGDTTGASGIGCEWVRANEATLFP
jgi:hypothetical protein